MLCKQLCFLLILGLVVAAPDWTKLNSMIYEAINTGVFPGAAVSVSTSKSVLLSKAYGYYEYKRDLYQANVTLDTKWDLDRVSQVVSLVPTYMHLIENGKLALGDHVSKYELDFDNNGKKNISIQNMMLHNSGFEAEYPGALPKTGEEVLKHINSAKLNYTVGSKTLYSNEGMVVLGEVIQKISNKTLEQYVYQVNVLIGIRNTNYVPDKSEYYRVAPTQYYPGKGLLRGKPMNAMADLINGTAGNAGIYSTLSDVTRFMRLLLAGGQLPGESRMFQKATIDQFTTKPSGLKYNNTRAYIFDTIPDEEVKVTGTKFSENSFGLYGLTGTMVWADKNKDVSIVLLSNAAYPHGQGIDQFKEFCSRLSDQVMTQLGY